jgi:cation-transporting ATPase E/undecaprenyl-diphosphatase
MASDTLDPRAAPAAAEHAIDERGLDEAQVRERQDRGEVNRFTEPRSRSVAAIVRAQVFTRFNALLGALSTLMLVLGPWQDALFGGVIVINALIGVAQELRAKRALQGLVLLSRERARVLRDGRVLDLPDTQIVRDDVLLLAAGDQVPVDAVVLSAEHVELDESLLSGEAEPVSKGQGEALLSGSLVMAGTARCRATRVGASAHAQRLGAQAREFHLARSQLRAGVNRLLRYVTWAIVPVGLLLVASQLGLGLPVSQALRFSVGGLVAMVPEGLVLLTSAALALGAIRLARRRALVQDLAATETLARVDSLCLDKTGTLTEREPVLERIEWLADEELGRRALSALAAADPHPNATLQAIARACGDSTEPAPEEVIPFSSAYKWAGARLASIGSWLIGAPDVLIADAGDATLARARELAQAGSRVLLLARAQGALPANHEQPAALTPTALLVLAERIRPDAERTLHYFDERGITIRLLSGDHPGTVAQVAARLGIRGADQPVDARQLPSDSQALGAAIAEHRVLCRATPEQKRSVIAALQAQGHVVAMVGDGANDILALKQADVGIAMGTGAGAARAVAHLVLVDNAFDRLPTVVDEGRRVIANVERVAALFMTKTVYATLLALAVGLSDVVFPFLPRHLTLIGALTIGVPGIALALQRSAERVRPGFVERVLRLAVPAGLLAAAASFAAYSLLSGALGADAPHARTGATVALFAVGLWIVGIVAQPLTAVRVGLLAAMGTTFALTLRFAPAREFFALEPLSLGMWAATACVVAATGGLAWWSTRLPGAAAQPAPVARRLAARDVLAWLIGRESPKWFVVSAAALMLGGAWLFLGVLEDVVSQDPLVQVDGLVHDLLQSVRTPLVDGVAVAITELGDVQVVLPVALVALGWFIAGRRWRTAVYWLAALGVAEALVKLIKLALHRPRPGAAYAGIEQFSFPSSHATLSVVVYGFLAFLVLHSAARRTRAVALCFVAGLVGTIALSRIYLGVHWVSDVMAGLAFGTAWIAALGLAYTYQGREAQARGLAIACLATFALAASVHITTAFSRDLWRYRQAGYRVDSWRSAPWSGDVPADDGCQAPNACLVVNC